MNIWKWTLVLLIVTTIVSMETFATENLFDDFRKSHLEYDIQNSVNNKSYLSLHFLPGIHYVSEKVLITDIANVEIFGNESVLSFKDSSALIIRNVTKLKFKSLNFTERVAVNITVVNSVIFEKCSVDVKGYVTALSIANVQTLRIVNSKHFSTQGGVLSVNNVFSLYIGQSSFIGNQRVHLVKRTAVVLKNIQSALLENCSLVNNSALYNNCNGGAMTLININKLKLSNSIFDSNTAVCFFSVSSGVSRGGAIYSQSSQLEISHCVFKNNGATHGGSIYSIQGSLYSSFNVFEKGYVTGAGGGIYVEGYFSTSIDHFVANRANFGGALWILAMNATIFGTYFESNIADYDGGALHVGQFERGLFESVSSSFMKNIALKERGGAVFVFLTTYKVFEQESTDSTGEYTGDILTNGLALLSMKNNTFSFNTANEGNGGAIYSVAVTVHLKVSKFIGNKARKQGASICHFKSPLGIVGCNFSSNTAHGGSMFYINSVTLKCCNCTFLTNKGSLNAVNSIATFSGTTLFANNSGVTGGSITSLQSRILFKDGTVNITENNATHGAGIFLFESQLNVTSFAYILNNVATDTGGGIYAYRSTIFYHRPEDGSPIRMELKRNSALSGGGGSYLIASTVGLFQDAQEVTKRSTFIYTHNTAQFGGAMYLDQTSKIYFYRVLSGHQTTTNLLFSQNVAEYGGAVYISDETASSELCAANDEKNANHYQTDCFIQVLELGNLYFDQNSIRAVINHHSTTNFIENSATKRGSAIYGGLFDRCSLNPNAEATTHHPATYMMVFDNYENPSHYISSEAVQVCFCTNVSRNVYDCTVKKISKSVNRGETFQVGVTAVDQLSATVLAEFSLFGGAGTLIEGQNRQSIDNVCTNIEFNLYTADLVVRLDIFAEGPCSNKGISKRTLEVNSDQCKCPIGFQQSKIRTKCECVCDSRLEGYIYNCSIEDESVLLSQNNWIGYVNSTENNTGFVIQTCPLDYCLMRPVNISFTAQGVDMQCAFNRSNLLCGQCEEGYSQVIGSSRCMICTNTFLSLLILFGFLGVILVLLILILNITVATGTIHGVIFYANIIGTTQSVFFANSELTTLRIFISWLNLDFGIETCFYDGMNAYAKVLLQLIFPIYLLILITTIIVLCEYSEYITQLFGKRNPVATLCTLILLSYSKLLNIVIAALQFKYLQYPNGKVVLVWLYDGTVPYFATSHIPRFIIAFLVLALGAIYTLLLFFGQWLPKFSCWKLTKWISHPKYNAFIDAYHAPFTEKHRYWVGLLLFVRILHTLVVALTSSTSVALLSIACVSLFLISLTNFSKSTYKNQKKEFFDNIVFINLVFLSFGTFYTRESRSSEIPLITISTTLIFVQFLILLGYHTFKYILDGSKIWTKLKQVVSIRRPTIRRSMSQHQLIPVLNDNEDEEDTYENNEVDHCLDDPTSMDTDSYSQQTYPPPNIQSALILDQLRLPYMDILDPITTDHYEMTALKQPTPSTNRPVSTTIVNRPMSQSTK